MVVILVLLLAALAWFMVQYLRVEFERERDEREFAELEVAWQQLRNAMRLYIADVEARRPKRGRNGRFVGRNEG